MKITVRSDEPSLHELLDENYGQYLLEDTKAALQREVEDGMELETALKIESKFSQMAVLGEIITHTEEKIEDLRQEIGELLGEGEEEEEDLSNGGC